MVNTQRPLAFLLLSFPLGPGSILLHAAPSALNEVPPCAASTALHGAWETTAGKTQIVFQEDEIVLRKNGTFSIAKILHREACNLLVRYEGLKAIWTVAPTTSGAVELKADESLTLRQLATVPPELDINLYTLPAPGPAISPAEAKKVEEEILARVGKDQEVLKNPALKDKRAEVVADNHRYLTELTKKVGWIDIHRFGKSAASGAILLAKHSGDLLLMKAALPVVERDVKESGGPGEMFSVLYDELQLELGNQQRYGTQIDTDKEGRPFILPLEDPAKVNAYRKEIGIQSFEDYLKLASDTFYKGAPIRIAGSNE